MRRFALFALVASLVAVAPRTVHADDLAVEAKTWQIVRRESGPVNYYSVVFEDGASFIRSRYAPPMKTAVLGYQVADDDRGRIKKVRWKWRAQALPAGGDECA